MKIFLVTLHLFFVSFLYAQDLTVHDLSCEFKKDPIGIDVRSPRLSWKISSSQRNWMQSAYQVRVASDASFGKKSMVWESGKINGNQSVLVKYNGPALQSAKRYYWQV